MFPDLKGRHWVRRRDAGRVVARMPLVPIHAGEAYYLRALLMNETARCYADLYGQYSTFRENADASGYVHSPTQNFNALIEAIDDVVSSYEFRRMFVIMLFFCGEMLGTWQHRRIREHLCHDFLPDERMHEDWSEEFTMSLCVMHMCVVASHMRRELRIAECGLHIPPDDPDVLAQMLSVAPSHSGLIREYAGLLGCDLSAVQRTRDHLGEVRRQLISFPPCLEHDLGAQVHSLRREQYDIFVRVIQALESAPEAGGCFHIDAPAGCGKTFLCQTILMWVRHNKKIALPCATTGIAALHFDGGTTAHSAFKLPLSVQEDDLSTHSFCPFYKGTKQKSILPDDMKR